LYYKAGIAFLSLYRVLELMAIQKKTSGTFPSKAAFITFFSAVRQKMKVSIIAKNSLTFVKSGELQYRFKLFVLYNSQ